MKKSHKKDTKNRKRTTSHLKIFFLALLTSTTTSSLFTSFLTPEVTKEREIISCNPSTLPHAFKMFGRNSISLNTKNPKSNFEHNCFISNTAEFSWKDPSKKEVVIIKFMADGRTKTFCGDALLITDLFGFEVKVRVFQGESKVEFDLSKGNSEEENEALKELTEIQRKARIETRRKLIEDQGIKVIPICDSFINLIPDVLLTIRTFASYLVPKKYQTKEFTQWYRQMDWNQMHVFMGKKMIKRTQVNPISVEWLKSYIEDGDCFCSYTPEGLSFLINIGTGGQCSHTGIFLWGENEEKVKELYILESSNDGVVKTEISKWLKRDGGDTVRVNFAILKLSKENQKNFNSTKAWTAFSQKEGLPYGFENFLFSFMDTPNNNLPQLFNMDSFMLLASIISTIDYGANFMDLVFAKAFGKRLGKENITLFEAIELADDKGMTIGEVFAMPEKPDYIYGEGDKRGSRFVCSAFATFILKEAGVFGDLEIYPQEFTPKDLWNLDIWDKNPPKYCRENDPQLPFCQLEGMYSFEPDDFGIIKPYSHMNERCPSKSPVFYRPSGC